jgi:subtilisin family serine protease
VGATTNQDTLATFSNIGTESVDIAAPGSYIQSTIPTNTYGYLDGTSMASPMVAGAISLLRSYRPDLSADTIRQAIYSGADNLLSLSGKIAEGRRLNLYNSLKLLDNISPTIIATGADSSNFCLTGIISYSFTGIDDIQLAENAYSFDNGLTRTGNNTYTTGATSIT